MNKKLEKQTTNLKTFSKITLWSLLFASFGTHSYAGEGDLLPTLDLPLASAYLERHGLNWIKSRECMSCHTTFPWVISGIWKNSGVGAGPSAIQSLEDYTTKRLNNWTQ